MKHRPILEIFTRNFSSTACPLIYNKQSDISMLHRADDYGSRAFIATSSVLSAGRICRVRISKLQRFLRRVADLTSVGLTARRNRRTTENDPESISHGPRTYRSPPKSRGRLSPRPVLQSPRRQPKTHSTPTAEFTKDRRRTEKADRWPSRCRSFDVGRGTGAVSL